MTEFVTIDVRSILASGGDPLGDVLDASDRLESGAGLRVLAPFRPAPLFRVMADRGFRADDRQSGDGWVVEFTPAAPTLSLGSAVEAALWPDPVATLDLTASSETETIRRLTTALALAGDGEVIFALTRPEPRALLDALSQGGYLWAGNLASDGSGFRLLTRRDVHREAAKN